MGSFLKTLLTFPFLTAFCNNFDHRSLHGCYASLTYSESALVTTLQSQPQVPKYHCFFNLVTKELHTSSSNYMQEDNVVLEGVSTRGTFLDPVIGFLNGRFLNIF